jgi:ComF family protein
MVPAVNHSGKSVVIPANHGRGSFSGNQAKNAAGLKKVLLSRKVKVLASSLLDFFLPRRCAGCQQRWLGENDPGWCPSCLDELFWIQSPLCPCCGRPYLDSPTSHDHLCGECLQDAFVFDTARSAAEYAGTVRQRIHQLKFGGQLHWVPPLVDLLVQAGHHQDMTAADLLVPVPLHPKRLSQRGFNQAGLLARDYGKRLGIEVRFDLLERTSWTVPQTHLNREERLQNVKGVFRAPRPDRIEGRTVLVLDDVFTTGSTLNECARVLKAAGAAEAHAVTVGRVISDGKIAFAAGEAVAG